MQHKIHNTKYKNNTQIHILQNNYTRIQKTKKYKRIPKMQNHRTYKNTNNTTKCNKHKE